MFQKSTRCFIISFSFTAALLGTPTLFAQPSDCDQQCESDVKKITEEFHHLLEGAESQAPKSFFINWARNFNFKREALNAFRAYQIKSADPNIKEHISNLAFMFPVSHAIEMSSMVWLPAISASLGFPDFMTGTMGFTGMIISVPGLDPICILLYTAYPASERLRNVVTYTRVKSIQLVNFAGRWSGVSYLAKTAREWMRQQWSERSIESLSFDENGITAYGDLEFMQPIFYLRWAENTGEKKFFSSITFTELGRDFKDWRRLLKNFPLNVREAISDARNIIFLNGNLPPFYVANVERENLTVEWRHRAVVADQSLQTCQALLSSRLKVLLPAQ